MNLLLAFDALLRERNVSRAAENLGLTQSAMSHALRRLREFYEDPLFVRIGDAMKPTPFAEEVSGFVLDIVSTVQRNLLARASFDPTTSVRVFSLCMTDMGELVFLPRLIEALQRLAPNCRIRTSQMSTEHIANSLEKGDTDLAIGSHYIQDPNLFQQELFKHSFATIVSNAYPHDEMDLQQFLSMKHISVVLSDRSTRYDQFIDDLGLQRDIYLTTPHFVTIPTILEGDLGLVATVPSELGKIFLRYKAVKVVKTPIVAPPLNLRQYWHPRHHHDPGIIWLRQLVKTLFDRYLD
ncbi:LysR family transcriptional regulator [Pseudomonas sp. MMS21-TM103]|uniref:LysR family transcriptional regulator n=1 Tax=Pseudomonas sp. MMS21 TM103 TaxID=2886506 RepID=UPI001EDD145B|nr:LysR family transcriptional regulator [Pseudomonas sp. MMS21 TM103]MCG4454933.1 LysR family transcriptional regulator [Pseudomonas sp. MMS21 TM103]